MKTWIKEHPILSILLGVGIVFLLVKLFTPSKPVQTGNTQFSFPGSTSFNGFVNPLTSVNGTNLNPSVSNTNFQTQVSTCINSADNYSQVDACFRKNLNTSDLNKYGSVLDQYKSFMIGVENLGNNLVTSITNANTYGQVDQSFITYYTNYLSLVSKFPLLNNPSTVKAINDELRKLNTLSANDNSNYRITPSDKSDIVSALKKKFKDYLKCVFNITSAAAVSGLSYGLVGSLAAPIFSLGIIAAGTVGGILTGVVAGGLKCI